jgi:RHS repeat-associated protein
LRLPDGSTEQWSYNANGDTSAYTNPLGQVVQYAYDDAGRNGLVDYATGTDTAFSYDAAGRRTGMSDATGTTIWVYDAASQLTQLVQPQGTLSYTYNLAGQRTAQSGAGQSQSWSYNASNGRLTSQTNGFGETTGFLYDSLGRVSRKTFSSGQYEDYGYDNRNRVTSIVLKNSSGTVLRTQGYAYDASSKITGHTVNGVTTAYAYDGAGQLLSESRPGYSGAYTYDGNGNRLTRTVNGVTENYAYDDGDKLLGVTVGGNVVKSYGYDAAGRTTSVVSSAGTTTLTYDFEGRATSIVGPGVSQSNVYDGLDTRVGSTTNSVGRTFLRDGAYVTDPVLSDGAATYTPGVSERRGAATTFLHSGIKSVDAQSTTAQTVTATRQYDAFGNLVTSAGTWNGPFGYAGGFGYQEDATGLRLLGHRYYDSSTGRFLTRDPIKDGRNWYAYCDSDPINGADPNGLEKQWYHYLLEYETWREGLITSGAALGSTLSLGFWDGGDYKDRPGFSESKVAWTVAVIAGSAAAGGAAAGGRGALPPIGKGAYVKRDLYHQLPIQIAEQVYRFGKKEVVEAGKYVLYKLPGAVNGKPGTYEVGVAVRNGVREVAHVLFKPL